VHESESCSFAFHFRSFPNQIRSFLFFPFLGFDESERNAFFPRRPKDGGSSDGAGEPQVGLHPCRLSFFVLVRSRVSGSFLFFGLGLIQIESTPNFFLSRLYPHN
jgi:hypothetical protein